MPLQPTLMSLTCIARYGSSSKDQGTDRGRKVQWVGRVGWLGELAEQRRQWSERSVTTWRMDVMRSVWIRWNVLNAKLYLAAQRLSAGCCGVLVGREGE